MTESSAAGTGLAGNCASSQAGGGNAAGGPGPMGPPASWRGWISRFLPTNRFARSVAVLAGGTAAAQVLVVISSPVPTRLYGPADFGLLAVFASLVSIIAVVASLRYQLAIPLPESDEEAAHVTVLSLLVVVGMTLLATLIVVFFRQHIASALGTPVLSAFLWLLPLSLLLLGGYQVFSNWAIRTKEFTALARTEVNQSVSMVLVQMGGYMFGPLASRA